MSTSVKNDIVRKIYQTYPNLNIKFKYNQNGDLVIDVPHNFILTILPSHNWDTIKRLIDKKINNKNIPFECGVCYNNDEIRFSCANCGNSVCLDCYVNIGILGRGLFVCPYCRYEIGYEWDHFNKEKYVSTLLQNLK